MQERDYEKDLELMDGVASEFEIEESELPAPSGGTYADVNVYGHGTQDLDDHDKKFIKQSAQMVKYYMHYAHQNAKIISEIQSEMQSRINELVSNANIDNIPDTYIQEIKGLYSIIDQAIAKIYESEREK